MAVTINGTTGITTTNLTATSITNTGDYDIEDNDKLLIGTGDDLQIYHGGSHSYIKNNTGTLQITADDSEFVNAANSEYKARYINNGAVELYYDGTKKMDTLTDGIGVLGVVYSQGLDVDDDHYIKVGSGDDLQIYHSGGEDQIRGTGTKFEIRSPNLQLQATNGEKYFIGTQDGAVELYHNNLRRIETTTGGCQVVGTVDETSDIALKEDIKTISNSLANLKQLTGYSYKFKQTGIASLGLTAQDVEKVFPELVKGEEGSKSLTYSGLIAPLIEAIKELSAEVDTLKTEKTKLQTDLTALTARVAALEAA